MDSPWREKEAPPAQRPSRRQETASSKKHFVVRKGAGPVHSLSNGGLKLEHLTHGANCRELKAAVVTAEPGAASEETEIYVGEKWCYVLEGKLELLVNDVSYVLYEGDSIYIESTAPHAWRNTHEGQTKALVFSSPHLLSI